MKFMLYKNICIHVIKHRLEAVLRNFLKHDPYNLCISSVIYAELMHGVEKSQDIERNRVAIALFLSAISIYYFDHYVAEEYGKICSVLERKGTPI